MNKTLQCHWNSVSLIHQELMLIWTNLILDLREILKFHLNLKSITPSSMLYWSSMLLIHQTKTIQMIFKGAIIGQVEILSN